jgi:hypothetical protein
MPKHILPWRNTPHRIAAIALYRALLLQSRKLPSASSEQRDAIQNIIRNRFKQSRHVQSPRLLKIKFEAGYEAVDHLDAAIGGDNRSCAYILDLLERSPARVKQRKPAPLVSRKKRAPNIEDAAEYGAEERPRINLFDRPLPLEKLSGKRHVPVLFNANHIPVLRLKKPQPASLSRYIRQRIEQRQIRHDRRHRLADELSIAKLEDRWDRLTDRTPRSLESAMLRSGNDMEPQWKDVVSEALVDVENRLAAESEKNRVMAAKMQAVVDREQALYDREKKERRGSKQPKRRTLESQLVGMNNIQDPPSALATTEAK